MSEGSNPPVAPPKVLANMIRGWLEKSGFPFELRLGHALRAQGFTVIQGAYFRDPLTGVTREIDLYASHFRSTMPPGRLHQLGVPGSGLRLQLVIECKSSRDKPWVVFSAPRGLSGLPPLTSTRGVVAQDLLLHTAPGTPGAEWVQNLPDRIGHGAVRAFADGKSGDPSGAYAALQGVAAATTAIAADADRALAARRLSGVAVPVPVIVLDGPLFEYYFDPERGEVLEPVDRAYVVAPGTTDNAWPLVTRVYAPTDLDAFAKELHAHVTDLSQVLLPHVQPTVLRLMPPAPPKRGVRSSLPGLEGPLEGPGR
jgi:hypothetical protein